MRPPSELTLLHIAAPGLEGGLESVLLELTGGLRQLGYRVVLAAVQDAGGAESPVLRRAADREVEVVRVEVPTRAYATELRRLRAVIYSAAPDVVHTHGYRADLLGGLAARQRGVPWVSTTHGFTGGDLKNRLYEWLQARALRRADAVIAVSDPIRNRLADAGIAVDRIHLIPNAWTPRPLVPRAEARRRLGIDDGPPVIGWVGRLTAEKGADVFLEALALLADRRWLASIIGDGRERSALEARARRLGIADRLHWHGIVPEAAGLYPAFDAWVLSSRTEGTPIALFEAMAARVPAVVTAVGGVPAVVSGVEAILVPSEQPAMLAAAIGRVLTDEGGATARAEAAYRRLVGRYATPGWLAAHVALYDSIRSTRSPGA
jgi:glycosyltransferase involved in cell wall biosynthesis